LKSISRPILSLGIIKLHVDLVYSLKKRYQLPGHDKEVGKENLSRKRESMFLVCKVKSSVTTKNDSCQNGCPNDRRK